MLTLLAVRRRKSLPTLLPLLLLGIFAATGCGANKYPYSTTPGTYTIPLTVTEHPTTAGSAVINKTVNVTLTVTER